MIQGKLPTDNLYKFIAIFGLVLIIASFLIPSIYNNKIRNDIEYFYQNYEKLGIDTGDLPEVLTLVSHKYYIENKYLTIFTFCLGIILVILGFILWYKKTQKYIDILLKEKAEENKKGEEFFSIDTRDDEELYKEAKNITLEMKKISANILQRKLRIGYARAATLLYMLEERGVIGPAKGSSPRDVLN